MTEKFKVYAQVRATRQQAGDIANEMRYNGSVEEYQDWTDIESKLQDLETKLEIMDLKQVLSLRDEGGDRMADAIKSIAEIAYENGLNILQAYKLLEMEVNWDTYPRDVLELAGLVLAK